MIDTPPSEKRCVRYLLNQKVVRFSFVTIVVIFQCKGWELLERDNHTTTHRRVNLSSFFRLFFQFKIRRFSSILCSIFSFFAF